jgi:plastocyanin domain-containing protein
MQLLIRITVFATSLALGACSKPGAGAAEAESVSTKGFAPGALGPIAIRVDESGYHPDSVHAKAGETARLVFTRTTDAGCGQQLVFPALAIKRDLPLNQPVAIDVPMPASGSVAFTCGMNMYRGAVVVQ